MITYTDWLKTTFAELAKRNQFPGHSSGGADGPGDELVKNLQTHPPFWRKVLSELFCFSKSLPLGWAGSKNAWPRRIHHKGCCTSNRFAKRSRSLQSHGKSWKSEKSRRSSSGVKTKRSPWCSKQFCWYVLSFDIKTRIKLKFRRVIITGVTRLKCEKNLNVLFHEFNLTEPFRAFVFDFHATRAFWLIFRRLSAYRLVFCCFFFKCPSTKMNGTRVCGSLTMTTWNTCMPCSRK